jgi:ATP-dependent RNA helicase RhlE
MPKEAIKLTKSFMDNPIHVNVKDKKQGPVDISQYIYHVNKNQKRALLKHVIEANEMSNVLVFSRTKHGANRITKDLNKSGISAEAIHGNKSQNAREKALNNFKNNSTRVLVATDIAARGIDIKRLPFVINFELPESPETYTHRIGRTGRAGEPGSALSFCDVAEKTYLKNIHRRTSHKLTRIDHPFA